MICRPINFTENGSSTTTNHELTFSTCRRRRLLGNDTWRQWLAESLDTACEQQSCRLVAFAFMPEDVHLLVFPEQPQPNTISEFLSTVKRPMSVRVKQQSEGQAVDPDLPRLQHLLPEFFVRDSLARLRADE